MKTEIIAIGDELTSGQRLDTNSQWLSQRLQESGLPVHIHTTAPDDMESLVDVFRTAARRAELVVATGGLGPTADDLTRPALAAAAGVELHLDEDSLRHIEAIFRNHGRGMPERNRLQAMFPAGSRAIPNPHGTAPGVDFEMAQDAGRKCRFFALPGVPAEMHEMWYQTVAPAVIERRGPRRIIRHQVIKCFGAGESKIESLLPDIIRRGRQPSVGITAHAATITLRVTAVGDSAEDCRALMTPTIQTIRDCLGTMVYAEGDEELQQTVVRLLREKGRTLATAECGTAGRIAHWLSELPEAVGVYRGGMVAADDASTHIIAGGKRLAENGAAGCREQFAADYGLAMGPLPDASDETDSLFFYALATAERVMVRSSTTAGHPAILKDRAAKQALNLLRLVLLREADSGED